VYVERNSSGVRSANGPTCSVDDASVGGGGGWWVVGGGWWVVVVVLVVVVVVVVRERLQGSLEVCPTSHRRPTKASVDSVATARRVSLLT
jgi:uncharacterized membrane protein